MNFFTDGGHDVVAWNAPRNLLIIVHNVAPPHALGNTLTVRVGVDKRDSEPAKGSSRFSDLTAQSFC